MKLTAMLGIEFPIIQAPMAGITTPEFVAASAEGGILGSVGAGYLSVEDMRKLIREVFKLTNRPFAVNLFVPEQIETNRNLLQQANQALQPIANELGIPLVKSPFTEPDFIEQIRVLIEEGVRVCSFTFGLPEKQIVQALKENNVFLIGTATTVGEAILAEQAGMDAVVVQGSEAGGHRGSFSGQLTFIPLFELLAEVVTTVTIPIIAAGGIANKEMKEQARTTGAQAVQIGTAFLATEESGAHPLHKKAVLNAVEGCTELTNVFSGKTARGIRNRFMVEMKDAIIAPYPYQNGLTNEIRKAAAKQGASDFMSLWAGENVHLSTNGKVKDIIRQFI